MPQFTYNGSELVLAASDQADLIKQLRTVGNLRDFEQAKAFGNLIAEPISLVAEYEEWSNRLFVNKQVNPGEDWKIPQEQYSSMAYFSTLEGRVRRTRAGITWTRPDFTTIKAGFDIGWNELKLATWDMVGNKTRRTAQEIARKRDELAFKVLLTASASVGQIVNVTGGIMTRAAVDNIMKRSAALGFPVERVVAPKATLQDMRSASFFTWDATKVPLAYGDPSMARDIFTKGYVGDYGDAEWFGTVGLSAGDAISGTTLALTSGQAILFFVGNPMNLGYNVQYDQVRQASDSDIDSEVNRYRFSETRFYYVGNPYNVWTMIISS